MIMGGMEILTTTVIVVELVALTVWTAKACFHRGQRNVISANTTASVLGEKGGEYGH